MGLYDFTFYDVIVRNAICYKSRPAWFEARDGRGLTYFQYKETVDRLACGLCRAGLKKGDRIGVIGKNCIEYFLLYGAASALGAIVLPINWRLSAGEIVFNLNDCDPVILFVDEEFQDLVENNKKTLTSVQEYYNLNVTGNRFRDIADLLDNSGDYDRADVSSDDGIVIIHTAAVAGKPRGALLSHGNMLCSNMHFNLQLNLTEKDVHLNILPMFHVGGLFMATSAFQAGALNVNVDKFEAATAVELIQKHKVSFMFDFSPILASILDEHEKSGKKIETLRAVPGLDSPDTIMKYQEVTGGFFYSLYGQTETSAISTFGKYNNMPGAAGKPLQLCNVRILDENDMPVTPGKTGEIALKGPMVFKGYWNQSEENKKTFKSGWHHTGDLGRFDENGFLWYEGRKPEKELIKPGGENVYPAEVENAILKHPAVERTVVFGVPDPKWKEGIKAVCLLKSGKSLKKSELIAFVGKQIASYKKPQYVEFVNVMPLLANGLPDREKMKQLYGGTI